MLERKTYYKRQKKIGMDVLDSLNVCSPSNITHAEFIEIMQQLEDYVITPPTEADHYIIVEGEVVEALEPTIFNPEFGIISFIMLSKKSLDSIRATLNTDIKHKPYKVYPSELNNMTISVKMFNGDTYHLELS